MLLQYCGFYFSHSHSTQIYSNVLSAIALTYRSTGIAVDS
jgi:hypothetical protein